MKKPQFKFLAVRRTQRKHPEKPFWFSDYVLYLGVEDTIEGGRARVANHIKFFKMHGYKYELTKWRKEANGCVRWLYQRFSNPKKGYSEESVHEFHVFPVPYKTEGW